MTDSTASQLLTSLQTQFTNYINNLANQRVKGVIVNGEALEVKLGYNPQSNLFHIMVSHVKTGLVVSDTYTSYQNALDVYNAIG